MTVAEVRSWHNPATGQQGRRLYMWCPGCDDVHGAEVDLANQPSWTWDGNIDAPTLNPSLLVGGVQWNPGDHFYKPNHHVEPGQPVRCHSFVKAGHWEFLGDSTHALAGQTVPLPPLPSGLGE